MPNHPRCYATRTITAAAAWAFAATLTWAAERAPSDASTITSPATATTAASTPITTTTKQPIRHIDRELNPDIINAWLDGSEHALQTAFGQLPGKTFDVTVNTSQRGTGVVPWGQVQRDRINHVSFVVNPSASLAALQQDWTVYHEFSHLLIPYQGWGDKWFSEGLASYYQNVIQARAGQLSALQARQKMLAGFNRGVAQNPAPHLPLATLSDQMAQYRAYMRVYWSGAWYFLQADIALRQQQQSLDMALAHLNHCCANQSMSVPAIIKRLDEYSQSALFTTLYEHTRDTMALTLDAALIEQFQQSQWPYASPIQP